MKYIDCNHQCGLIGFFVACCIENFRCQIITPNILMPLRRKNLALNIISRGMTQELLR